MNRRRPYDGTNTTVSVLGLGALGTAVAGAFLDHGDATTVWNRTPARADDLVARGAVQVATPEEAVRASRLIVVCVSDYDVVRSILQSADQALPGRAVVNLASGTPEAARELAVQLEQRDVGYLDGAAMSGTQLVGRPEALFLFSGSVAAFKVRQTVLESLGSAVHLGPDPGLASLYDTALLGTAWGALIGFLHGVALVRAENVDPTAFAAVAVRHRAFVTRLMIDHARQIEADRFPADDGTVAVHAAAMQHLIRTSRTLQIGADVPELIHALLDRSIAAGRGEAGIASVIDVIATPAGRRDPSSRGDG
jgi:3-hydroxyisobutyrate dehydrogenase-like beta-hydroxyacid dehydrogenase